MRIDISDQARAHLCRKIDFFLARGRVPRIVLAERSCSGANFRLFFESAHDDDRAFEVSGLKVFVPKGLIDEFNGFSLDMEQFFLNRRLKITPLTQSFRCDCSEKCPSTAAEAAKKDR
ncbi:MAG: hypothetical protein RBR69_04865 [Candidatus Cloacimonadaceae bacterium]|jgi:Fe-S cluster assembly iron-binding protein IscA|nr:hypothetical protein [Candidatus Cloacimonadota bacterium]MDY0127440.1 hypothetical protein [Candidatus Cloacimonadaceae bacterium]MCB5255717.1 hypothetical protein [Candidatus Cloacimonadota bacterium]MCK9178821.1 hypothetical protein [Candidatus Cloacimonadota bacterium]MCK9242216.1 hypothetical protein [Candidatus Cloacimonadota bacterium]